jgi:hypothetical protein
VVATAGRATGPGTLGAARVMPALSPALQWRLSHTCGGELALPVTQAASCNSDVWHALCLPAKTSHQDVTHITDRTGSFAH